MAHIQLRVRVQQLERKMFIAGLIWDCIDVMLEGNGTTTPAHGHAPACASGGQLGINISLTVSKFDTTSRVGTRGGKEVVQR